MKDAILGFDVGGANLKAAHTNGAAQSRAFALWKDPTGLAGALRGLIAEMPAADALAVTMTGELCDCFESKRQGVIAILDAVEAAAAGKPVRVWTIDGRFADLTAARAAPLKAAAANWLALATFAGRFAPEGTALLMDVGSTTTDFVPLQDGRPVPKGRTDRERLRSRELVYIGVRRTPLCAILSYDGAAELFATTFDLFILLDWMAEDPTDCNTADGRPATKAAAEARLARMECMDLETSTAEERMKLAKCDPIQPERLAPNGAATGGPPLAGTAAEDRRGRRRSVPGAAPLEDAEHDSPVSNGSPARNARCGSLAGGLRLCRGRPGGGGMT